MPFFLCCCVGPWKVQLSACVSSISPLPQQVTATHRSWHQAASQIRFVDTPLPEQHHCQATKPKNIFSKYLFKTSLHSFSTIFKIILFPLPLTGVYWMLFQRLSIIKIQWKDIEYVAEMGSYMILYEHNGWWLTERNKAAFIEYSLLFLSAIP